MRIIKIIGFPDGAHQNQTYNGATVPDGWAVIPDGMAVPDTFPFVNITVDGQTVTSMTAGVVPEPEEPATTPEERISALEEENHLLIQQVTALTDQNDFQEELIVELANIVYA